MKMNILVGYDGSNESKDALNLIMQMKIKL
jgi:hypothetical protein